MRVRGSVTGIGTPKLVESRDFYTKYLGFQVIFENDWYILLQAGSGGEKVQVAFVLPDHPSQPPIFQTRSDGKGVFLQLEVDDAEAEYERFKAAGIEIPFELQDEPWGERHFAFYDPNGVAVSLSQETEMEPEYAELVRPFVEDVVDEAEVVT